MFEESVQNFGRAAEILVNLEKVGPQRLADSLQKDKSGEAQERLRTMRTTVRTLHQQFEKQIDLEQHRHKIFEVHLEILGNME
jgi:hypothetical protein